jgi:hypothetical protein
MVISLWILLRELEDQGLRDELILALGDNTSAIGWMVRTNHLKCTDFSYNAANFIARKAASLFSESKNFMAPQHVAGKQNHVADWLTFEGEERSEAGVSISNPIAYDRPTNCELTHRFRSLFPQLVPNSFKISPLPTEIFLFAERTLQMLESSLEHREKQLLKTGTGCGGGGAPSVASHLEESTPLLSEYPQQKKTSSSKFSLKYTEDPDLIPNRGKLLASVRSRWQDKLSQRPRVLWLRGSGTVSGGRPFTHRYETTEACQSEQELASSLT